MTDEKKQKRKRGFGNTLLNLVIPGRKRRQDEQDARSILEEEAIRSPWRNVFEKFVKNPLAIVGVLGFIFVFAVVFIGSALMPFDAYYTDGPLRNIGPGTGYADIPQQLLDEGVEQISSGISFSIGLSKEGKVYQWGKQIDKNLEMPKDIAEALAKTKVVQVAAGDRHILVLTEDEKIYGWGDKSFEQTALPANLKATLKKEGIAKIGAGDLYSVVLTKEGTIKVWGSVLPSNLSRISKKLDGQVADFRTGSVSILILRKDGALEVIGTRGTELETAMPEEIKNGQVAIKDFARTQKSAAVITEDGKLIAWGSSTENAKTAPTIEGRAEEVVAGRSFFVVRNDAGKLYTWGTKEYGVQEVPQDDGYEKLFAGFYNAYAMKNPNEYKAWGLNGFTLGTDEQGRDLFTRLIHGGKATLQISFIAVLIEVFIGVTVGMISGFYGGWVDNLLMRFSEIIASFPFYPTIITLSAAIPPDASQYQRILLVMVLLGILSWTGIARLVRGQILAEREKDYIMAARALGLRERNIIMSHIFPNIVSIVIVQATLGYASNLLVEAGLSFLGFGVKPPFPSWGNMMSSAQSIDVIEKYWWRWIYPGLAVFLTAFTVNLIGDALRDAIDPKSQER
uniref:ABC transporter permease subunit n=1 Tax=Ndongobacter massiliensis TaxID=1871025 RepID=UPI0009316A5D|nr:ABC transporter permease subunit [Ndongobacter massiliensis]